MGQAKKEEALFTFTLFLQALATSMNILVEGRSFGIALLWTYIFHVHPHSMMTRFLVKN